VFSFASDGAAAKLRYADQVVWEGVRMSFTAKVIATGEFFWATTDLGPGKEVFHDAQLPLDKSVFYEGFLYPGSIAGASMYVDQSTAKAKTFSGSELEEVQGNVRLKPVHKSKATE
jgi:hypothetical protein